MEIILASASPRRQEILGKLIEEFKVQPPNIDESLKGDDYIAAVKELALNKAKSINAKDSLVISADTIVVCDNKILGKPADEKEAFEMLKILSGKTHSVITAMAFVYNNKNTIDVSISNISFNQLTDDEINMYIKTKEPLDKAGAYGIQGLAGMFVSDISGDYYATVGLSFSKLYTRLKEFGAVMRWNIEE